MRFPSPSQRLAHPVGSARDGARTAPPTAAALLGEGHRLVGVLASMEIVARQLAVVAVVHAVGLVSWRLQLESGAAVAVPALGLEAVLACRLFLLAQVRRQECVTLIAEGREDLALDSVARERRRLSSRRYRARLARAIDELARPQAFGVHPLSARPPIEARVLEPVRPLLREIALALPRDDASIRGVARLELLISAPTSALYDGEPDRLRREVGRVRYLLMS
jgi:hypothetical protein